MSEEEIIKLIKSNLLIGDKQNNGQKVHLIFGETGEIQLIRKTSRQLKFLEKWNRF